ncbi:MAG: ATP-dependent DNA ligase [Natrialbaceae archaeon]|nr:ATP-dependent DNA ligase [Natrialbaceae archaeon]
MPDLSDRDREEFERLRSVLEGVTPTDPPESDPVTTFTEIDPMLAQPFNGSLETIDESQWHAEPKYDGTRIILECFDETVRLYTRRHIDRAEAVPRVTEAANRQLPADCILDGELTFFDADGTSQFLPIHSGDRDGLEPTYVVFDVLVQDGEWVTREPLTARIDRLERMVPETDRIRTTDRRSSDLEAYYDRLVASGEEGIMLKRSRSHYHVAIRSDHWRKVKSFDEVDVLAVGYTEGTGRRSATFGALVLRDSTGYIGKVGSGFTEHALEAIASRFEPSDERRVPVSAVGESYTAIEPFVVSVKFQEFLDSRRLRAPVFLRLRPEKPLESVQSVEDQLANRSEQGSTDP